MFKRVAQAAAGLLAVATLGICPATASPALTTLYSFTNPINGQAPMGALVFDGNGALYGTTSGGGNGCLPQGCGTVFRLTPPATATGGGAWTETVLHSFNSSDGAAPQGDLVADTNGVLYGTTVQGGLDHGTVFALAPPAADGGDWTLTVLHEFTGLEDGDDPGPSLTMDENGALYGVTQFNSTGAGTVFQLQPPINGNGSWTYNVLWVFGQQAGDGTHPLGGVVLGAHNTLYGTTFDGGAFDTGGVYSLQRVKGEWKEKMLHSFPALRSTGANPFARPVVDATGSLYGTASIGGKSDNGVAFQLTPSRKRWTETVTHSFANNGKDGFNPIAPLTLDASGILYGTTPVGGISDAGTVFELLPPAVTGTKWQEKVLWSFHALPVGGNTPEAGLILDGAGGLYGTTASGGSQCRPPTGCGGTVFMLTP